jgi:sugar phosphate isomerase/epimerase
VSDTIGRVTRTARELGPSDLVWDYSSRPPTESMTTRVWAAASADYAAIGMNLRAWSALRADAAELEEFDAALGSTGLVVANIETLRGWAAPDRATDACTRAEGLAYELADRYGCRYVQVIGDFEGSIAEAGAGFGALCDRAADHGLLVGLEPVPSMTNIDRIGLAATIVEAADRANGGICFDSWHLTRSGDPVDVLSSLEGRCIVATQFNDGTVEPAIADYFTDTLSSRVVPGDGEFRLDEMVATLDAIGSRAPIGLEVPGLALWEQSAERSAQLAADAMRSVLAQVRD